jgi:hypothetical protein
MKRRVFLVYHEVRRGRPSCVWFEGTEAKCRRTARPRHASSASPS